MKQWALQMSEAAQKQGVGWHTLLLCVFPVITGQEHILIKTLAAIDSKGRKECCYDFRSTLTEEIYA